MVVLPLPFTEVGEKLHVASDGNPEQEAAVKLMVPLYEVLPVMVRVVVPLCLAAMVMGAKVPGRPKSGTTFTKSGAEVDPE